MLSIGTMKAIKTPKTQIAVILLLSLTVSGCASRRIESSIPSQPTIGNVDDFERAAQPQVIEPTKLERARAELQVQARLFNEKNPAYQRLLQIIHDLERQEQEQKQDWCSRTKHWTGRRIALFVMVTLSAPPVNLIDTNTIVADLESRNAYWSKDFLIWWFTTTEWIERSSIWQRQHIRINGGL